SVTRNGNVWILPSEGLVLGPDRAHLPSHHRNHRLLEQTPDEVGPTALLRTPGPVNKVPRLCALPGQRLQTLCPRLGKVKLAPTAGACWVAPGCQHCRAYPARTAGSTAGCGPSPGADALRSSGDCPIPGPSLTFIEARGVAPSAAGGRIRARDT